MLMGIQMMLTVFIISITFGAETEFQRGIILFGPAADRTFMFGDPGGGMCLLFEIMSPFHLLRRHVDMVSAGQEEYNKLRREEPITNQVTIPPVRHSNTSMAP